MPPRTLTCPHCGFVRVVPDQLLEPEGEPLTCGRCHRPFRPLATVPQKRSSPPGSSGITPPPRRSLRPFLTLLLLLGAALAGLALYLQPPPPPPATVTASKSPAPVIRPTLQAERSVYLPGESINLSFTAPAELPGNAWVGVIPSHIPHGDEGRNDQHDLAYHYLRGATEGSLTFTAPSVAGSYDLRMHDTDANGREIASFTLTVLEPQTSPPLTPQLHCDLQRVTPGESFTVHFSGIAAPTSQDWISLYPVAAGNRNHGEYHYLGGKGEGEVTFTAPTEEGEYNVRLFLNWPAGGYDVVAQTAPILIAEPPIERIFPPQPSAAGQSRFSASLPDPEKLIIDLVARNYSGILIVNNEQIYQLAATSQTLQSYAAAGHLRHGENRLVLRTSPLQATGQRLSLRVVFPAQENNGQERIVAVWEGPADSPGVVLDIDLSLVTINEKK